MFKTRPLPVLPAAIGAALCAMALAAPATAAAAASASAPLAITIPSAMPLAAVGMSQMDCRNAQAASPIAPVALTRSSARAAKSAAILGGRPSALEALKLQQSAGASRAAPTGSAPLAPALPVAGGAVPVAALGFACIGQGTQSASTAAPTTQPAVTVSGRFLGTERVRIGRTRYDDRWSRVAGKTLSQRDLTGALGAVPSADDTTREALLSRVNGWVNRAITYRSDRGGDRWADARTTLKARAGDCEDYAILKMEMLAAAGVPRKDMMLTLARDTMRRADHAVLLVKHEGSWVMLDMARDTLAPANYDYGYRAVLSFAADNTRYVHGRKLDTQGQNTQRKATRLALAQ